MFSSEERDKIGITPDIDRVLDILEAAAHCYRVRAHEHAWNCAVHFPLLSLAVYGGARRKPQLVGFDEW